MIELRDVTLIGVDCVDINRLCYAADICCENISFGAIKLLSSSVSDDTRSVVIPAISSRQEYSEFIITQLTNYFNTPYALIFQYDGFILNPQAWTDDFLQYDYIGAVWTHLDEECVGNGGFSLRSKRLLDYLAQNYKVEHFPTLPALNSAYANIKTTTLPLDKFIASTDTGAHTPAPNARTPHTLIHFSEHNLDIVN